MARVWGTIGAGLTTLLLAVGLQCAPVSAEQIDWRPGPVTTAVIFDTAPATAAIPPGEVEGVEFSGPVCFTPDPVPGEWNGQGVIVTVDEADADALSCTVRASVRYCSWELWRHTCNGIRVVDLWAEGGPLHVDSENPLVTGAHVAEALPNAEGWFRSAGVIRWSGRDIQSGIESCTTAVMSGTDTRRTTVLGICRDHTGHASDTFAYTYRLDATPPTLQPAVRGTVELGAPAGADPGASDETSGVAMAVCNGRAPLDTDTTGPHTVVCSAVDVAGNAASASTTYTVGYGFAGSGFRQADTSSQGSRHPVRAGTAAVLTFRVTSDVAGTPMEHLDPTRVKVRVAPAPCTSGAPGALSAGRQVPSGLRELPGGRYRLVWSVPRAWAGSCGRLSLDLGDGLPRLADLVFLR